MENNRCIEINAAIFPSLMQIGLGKPYDQSEADVPEKHKVEVMIDLPRGAYLLYLQKMADDHNAVELNLLNKYAYGISFTDDEYRQLIQFTLVSPSSSTGATSNHAILEPWGLTTTITDNGRMEYQLIPEAIPKLRAETWEYILISHLRDTWKTIIECFDFQSFYIRESENTGNNDKLQYSLWPWKFSSDKAEQSLSSAFRLAFLFTLFRYSYEATPAPEVFIDYFEVEFMRRVSLIFDLWVTRGTEKEIRYLPVYDGFFNLRGVTKDELIDILKRILDCPAIDRAEKDSLLKDLVSQTTELHFLSPKDAATETLENDLIKPAVNAIYLREKARESLSAAEVLYNQGLYSDCANRCYYAMMHGLKCLLEKRGALSAWKPTALKGNETHTALEAQVSSLVACGDLDVNDVTAFSFVRIMRMKCDYELVSVTATDIQQCVQHAQTFISKIDSLL